MRQQRDLWVNTEALDLFGCHHGHFGNFLRRRVLVHMRIADKQRTCRQHQIIHRRQHGHALAFADYMINHPKVTAELPGHTADQAIGITQLQQHRADQRWLAAHRFFGDRRRHTAAGHQLVVRRPALPKTLVRLRIDNIEIDTRPDTQLGFFEAMFDHAGTADQNRAGKFFFDNYLSGAQHALIFTFGKNDALALSLTGGLENGSHADTGVIDELGELGAVGIKISNRPRCHAGIHCGLSHGRGDLDDQARVERLWNQVFRAERQVMAGIGHGDFIGHFGFSQFGNGANAGHLHFFGNAGSTDIECATEDEGEAEDVVDLIHIVGTAGGNDDVGPHGFGQFRHDFRSRVGESENHWLFAHARDHFLLQHACSGEAEEDIGPDHRIAQRAIACFAGVTRLGFVHAARTTDVDHAL